MGRGDTDTGGGDITWQTYEELTKDIYQALGRATGVAIKCWGSSCRVPGQSGASHQIDVLTSHSDGIHQYKTAIECKYWDEKVGIDVIRETIGVIQDTRMSKGIVVSKMGFSDEAKKLAAFNSIELVELRKPIDEDWSGYIREVSIEVMKEQPPIYRSRLQMTIQEDIPGGAELQREQGAVAADPAWYLISVPGHPPVSLRELLDAAILESPGEATYNIEFPQGSFVTFPDNPEHPLFGQLVTGVVVEAEYRPPMEISIQVRLDDYVYMIMESLFDGRRFTITKDGEIRENGQVGR